MLRPCLSACTNFGIRLQIDPTDNLNADFVIINATTSRIDFKINNSERYTHENGWDNNDKTLLTDSLVCVQDDLDTLMKIHKNVYPK